MDVLCLFNHFTIDSKEVSKTHMDKKNKTDKSRTYFVIILVKECTTNRPTSPSKSEKSNKENKKEHRTNGANIKQIVRWVNLNPYISPITLSINVVNSSVKMQRLSNWKITMIYKNSFKI